ncbi:MAG: SHOCT domain-containing protein [Rhodobacteraceae bacterium]|nr:SHOCT domain-containing protein [Paracoccaceae bacterium]MBR9823459.1 SHOCT domain-containing protein [Paracoccaceae bacterium]
MIKRMSVVTSSALVLSVGAALADPSDSWGEGFGHMMWGGGFGMVGGLMMLLFWGAIIALIVFAVRGFSAGSGSADKPDAADILRERYAKGEIDDEEYERRKAKLGL